MSKLHSLQYRGGSLLSRRVLRERMQSVGNRLMEAAELVLHEQIDARIARVESQRNEIGLDPFGFDPATARYGLALAALLHRKYFRTDVHGIENVPQGRSLVVGNHSGQIPLDAVVVSASLMLDADPPRFPRSMVEKWTATLPFFSYLYPRLGQVVGTQDNAKRLLNQGSTLVVFPEGVQGIAKPFRKRYQLEPFGLGFMRLALETQTPIVPTAIIGGEEQYISVANLQTLAKAVGMPVLPVIPQLFTGFLLPLPTKYRLYFGEPLFFDGDPDDEDRQIMEKVTVVRQAIQELVQRGLAERKSIFR